MPNPIPPVVKRVAVPAISFAQVPQLIDLLKQEYPDCKINTELIPRYHSEEDVIAFLRGYDAAIVSFEPITQRVLNALPELRVVSKLGVGLENIDPVAMQSHGVRLGWTAGVNKRAVAELALCLAIAALRHVVSTNIAMREGLRPLARVGRELTGRTVGVHGCGHIGQEFIQLLAPFQCRILASDIEPPVEFYRMHHIQSVSECELFERSEVLSIHLSLNDKSKNLYSATVLDQLRPDCVLINTARGGIVDEVALKERLQSRRLAAAAFDVFALEPTNHDELLRLENFIATPHLGSGSIEARLNMGKAAIRGLSDNFIPKPGVAPFNNWH
jgi:phosphoglycerate dehydrogenase-like enzyme